jgi:transcriptional regulator
MMIIEKELETTKDNLRALKREHEKVKSDFEQTLKMCEAYESKITTLTRREEGVRNMVDQSK